MVCFMCAGCVCTAPFKIEEEAWARVDFKTQLQRDLEEMISEADRRRPGQDPTLCTFTGPVPTLEVLADTAEVVEKAEIRGDPAPSVMKTRASLRVESRTSYADVGSDESDEDFKYDLALFKERPVFSKRSKNATLVLREWFNRNITWPYPERYEVERLVNATRLNKKQLSHWFVNWRKRHWADVFNRVIPLNRSAVEVGCCTPHTPRLYSLLTRLSLRGMGVHPQVYLERKFGSLQKGIDALLCL